MHGADRLGGKRKGSYFTTKRQDTVGRKNYEPLIPCFKVSRKTKFLITTKIGGINSITGQLIYLFRSTTNQI